MSKKKIPLPSLDVLHDFNLLLAQRDAYKAYLKQGADNVPLKERMQVTLRLAILENLRDALNDIEPLLKECEEYILEKGAEEEKAALYRIYASKCFNTSKYTEGLSYGVKALDIYRDYPLDFRIMDATILCGTFCMFMNMEPEGIAYMKEAYALAGQLPDKKKNAAYRSHICDNYLVHLPLNEAVGINRQILEDIRSAFGSNYMLEANVQMRFAELYIKAGKLSEASSHADQGLELMKIFPDVPNHSVIHMNLYLVKAKAAAAKKDEKKLLHNTGLLFALAEKTNRADCKAEGYFTLLIFYTERGDFEKAKEYLGLAEVVVPKGDRGALYSSLLRARDLYYKATGDKSSLLKNQQQQQAYKLRMEQDMAANRVNYVTTLHELEMQKKEMAQQKAELEIKTQELNMTNYHLQLRNQLLNELKDNIGDFKKAKSKADTIFKSISDKIEHAFIKEDIEKEQFREKFDETHRSFIARLHQLYPKLSPTECRICALLQSGFNTKEIGNLLSTAPRNIENHRLSIRKKMNLTREDNLNLILTQVK